jgi:1-aminocyclopropane-1-carboxylate deaminase/D-cysteine desulfhydrase-like pyridoxal-dependent ACC family enzyme
VTVPVELRPVRKLALQVPSPIEELTDERLTARGIRLFLKRDDLINPEIPGNKWRKLKYNLVAAAGESQHVLLTFGGPTPTTSEPQQPPGTTSGSPPSG